jgi:hypothetical protein
MAGEFDKRFSGRIEWTGFLNMTGQNIPPFSIVSCYANAVCGWQMPDPSGANLSATAPILQGYQPTDPINPYALYITGSGATPAGTNGACARPTLTTPLLLSLSSPQQDQNDQPFRMCGPCAGSWQGTRDMPGFAMVATPQQGYALAVPTWGPYVGQVPDVSSGGMVIGSGTTGNISTASASDHQTGDESVTAATLPVYNRFQPLSPGDSLLFDWSGQGWEVVADGGIQAFVTVAGPSSGSDYPKLSAQPNVYCANRLYGIQFQPAVGNQQSGIGYTSIDTTTAYYLYCDLTYLFEGTVVLAQNGIVLSIVTGSRFELGLTGTLTSLLSSGGSSTVSVTYQGSSGAQVTDTLNVIESMGLATGTSIPSGTRVFVEFDSGLYQWVVVATACAGGGTDNPISKPRSGDYVLPGP